MAGAGRTDSQEIPEYMLLSKSLETRGLDPDAWGCCKSPSQVGGKGVRLYSDRAPPEASSSTKPSVLSSRLPSLPFILPAFLSAFPADGATEAARRTERLTTDCTFTPDALLQTARGPSPTVLILFFHE